MPNEIQISPKNLAHLLDVPVYLFSDLPAIHCEVLEDGTVVVNDAQTPALNGLKMGKIMPVTSQANEPYLAKSIGD